MPDMDFVWHDYDPRTMGCVEDWLDESAVKATGLDEGFRSFHEYWANEGSCKVGENYWCKVVSEGDRPFAAVAFCEHDGMYLVMEIVVAPAQRGQGKGSRLLKELLSGKAVPGMTIRRCEAVIFPGNTASQRAFGNAGFRYHHTHPDGDALYYVYDPAD